MGRSNNKVHVQINSLEALERLLGNDAEFEFDIRNNIVQKFTEKHLKQVANSELMHKAEEKIKEYLYTKKGYKTVINPEFTKKIEDEINFVYKQILNKKFYDLKQIHLKTINERLDRFKESVLNDYVEEKLNEKLKKVIDAKVDSKIKRIIRLINEDETGNKKISSMTNL
jgi:predicted transcriptional regulator